MARYRHCLLIFSILLFAWLIMPSAFADNPFETKSPLKILQGTSVDPKDSASKKAIIGPAKDDTKAATLAVMADLHVRPESLPMLQKAISRVNALDGLCGLAIVGDLCSKLGTKAEYEIMSRGLKDLSVSAYAVPGNHDILYKANLVNGEKKRGTPAEKLAKQQLFKKTFNLKSLYYAKRAGGHLLIFLPNDTLSAIPCVLPSDEAFHFLRKTLRENKDTPTIIFCHAPLAGSYGDKKTMPPIQANAQPTRKIQAILQENPQVFLWFAGHLHITPSQKYFNCPENKVGKVTVIHVPPSQIHSSWVQTVRLSPKGAIVRTMDVKTGKYLKKHTRVFKHGTIQNSNSENQVKDKAEEKDKNNSPEPKKARIVVVNAHSGGNRNRPGFGDWLADQEPDIALISEASFMAPHLRQAGRFFSAGHDTKGQREVAVVVRDGLPVTKHNQGKISPDLGSGIAHDRWWTMVQTRVAGIKSRIYSLHFNAVIQQADGHPRQSNRWTVTQEGLKKFEKHLKQDIKDGWAVIIGGDFNWRDSRENARSHHMAPGNMLNRLGMTYNTNELMWLAWTPKTHKSVKRVAIPPTSIAGLFAGEHPALRIDLQARKQHKGNEPDREELKQDTSDEEATHKDSDDSPADESELESENTSDDDLLDSVDVPTQQEPIIVADAPKAVSEETELTDQEPLVIEDTENTTDESDLIEPESESKNPSDSDSAGKAVDDEKKVPEEASDTLAIERIRELIAELYDYLEKLFWNFSSLLR